jgi:hypothetical protein
VSEHARRIGAALLLAIGLPACSDCHPSPTPAPPTLARASAAVPLLSASAAPSPVASNAAPPAPTPPAQDDALEGCGVTVGHDVTKENLSGWVALWKSLSAIAPADSMDPDAGAPPNAAAIRERLGVTKCAPACVVTWPPSFPPRASYVVVPLPNRTLDLHGPLLMNELEGQCAGQMGGSIEGEGPLHAGVRVEEASSTRVCPNDAGEMVEEQEGMESCMSACVSESFRTVDFFLGASGNSALIERHGYRGVRDTREHGPTFQRKGDALIVRGENGCTRWIDLRLSPPAR